MNRSIGFHNFIFFCLTLECGGHLDGKKGILKLPKFSPSNSHPLSCKWTIKVPHGSQVELHVRSLGFGKQMNCDRNYFEVKRHKRFDLKSVSKLCPSAGAALDKELVIQSASKHVTIWYISEKIPAKDSFRVIWRARRKGTV